MCPLKRVKSTHCDEQALRTPLLTPRHRIYNAIDECRSSGCEKRSFHFPDSLGAGTLKLRRQVRKLLRRHFTDALVYPPASFQSDAKAFSSPKLWPSNLSGRPQWRL